MSIIHQKKDRIYHVYSHFKAVSILLKKIKQSIVQFTTSLHCLLNQCGFRLVYSSNSMLDKKSPQLNTQKSNASRIKRAAAVKTMQGCSLKLSKVQMSFIFINKRSTMLSKRFKKEKNQMAARNQSLASFLQILQAVTIRQQKMIRPSATLIKIEAFFKLSY